MNIRQVQAARKMAAEFINRADAVTKAFEDDKMLFYGSKETASLRRQSMELSRSLSALRKH